MAGSSHSVLGLCGACRYARRVPSARGSVFLRCGMHDVDARYRKYPPLPVTACPGFAPPEEDPPP
ncbi:MAG: hypothetical protein M0R73_11700 [Dehalococcoidia bacterium]|nr:hypothetical protein [Dehalococcoidia bacterium]